MCSTKPSSPVTAVFALCSKGISHENRFGHGLFDGLQKFMLAALNFSRFLKLNYYGSFTYITQIVHSNAYFNPLKGNFSDNQLIIAEI